MPESTRPSLQFRAEPPAKQRRVTVLFRLILFIPQVALAVVYYAVGVATFFGWFAAVITGRNPFQRFTISFLQWLGRANGYLLFLTDVYPPLTLGTHVDYPVRLELATGRLRRTTVGFRVILVIPAFVVTTVLGAGVEIAAVIAWLITLITGRLPSTLHKAFEASIRFNLRVLAYFLLAQEPYPRHLFGDATSTAGAADPDNEPHTSELSGDDSAHEPSDTASRLAQSQLSVASSVDGAASESVGALTPMPPLREDERASNLDEGGEQWPLVVAKSARVLLSVLMVIGAAGVVMYLAYVGPKFQNNTAEVEWASLYRSDISAITQAVSAAQPDFDATPLRWHAIAVDCSTINSTLATLNDVAQYPLKSQDRVLLTGVAEVSSGVRACLDTAVPKFDAAEESAVAQDFATGNQELNSFLNQIPIRAFAT